MKKIGEITLYWGSMFTGKTTKLIEELIKAGEGAICFKPIIDNRFENEVIKTHNGHEFPATAIKQASEIFLLINKDIQLIGIDEVSLFGNDRTLIPTIETLRDIGYNIVLSGLDMDRHGKPFGQMPAIAAIADNVFKLRTICASCGDKASISSLKTNDTDSLVLIGGENEYEPLCRTCYSKRLPL